MKRTKKSSPPPPPSQPEIIAGIVQVATWLRGATLLDLARIHRRIADLNLELAMLHEAKRALALHLAARGEVDESLADADGSDCGEAINGECSPASEPPPPGAPAVVDPKPRKPPRRSTELKSPRGLAMRDWIRQHGPSTPETLGRVLRAGIFGIKAIAWNNKHTFTFDGERIGLIEKAGAGVGDEAAAASDVVAASGETAGADLRASENEGPPQSQERQPQRVNGEATR